MLKNLSKLSLLIILSLSIFLVGCDDDDKDNMDAVATISVDDQVISQNMIWVNSTDLPQDGFIVIHKDNGSGAPVVPAIISEPIAVKSGMETDILVPIKSDESLSDGETLWVMLHEDTGQKGVYEFDGSSGIDNPFKTNDDAIVMTPIEINSASISVNNQPVDNNTIVIDKVTAARDGWLVIHNDDGTGNIVLPGIIGKVQVQAGVNENVSVTLDGTNTYTTGQKLFPMLHLHNGIIGQYEFDGSNGFDGPEIFSNDAFPGNVIFTSFEVQ